MIFFLQAKAALVAARQQCAGAHGEIEWLVHWNLLEQWLDAVPTATTSFKKLLMQAIIADLHSVSLTVEKLTPKIDHYVNDKLYTKALAKRNLANSSNKETMSKSTVTLFKSMARVGRWSAAWGFPDPRKNPAFSENMAHADCVYDGAKKVVAVTAAATILATMSGEALKLNSASILNSHRALFPTALLDELKAASK